MYHNNLMVRRNNRFVTVESGRTLRDAKLREGDVCKIRGYIRIEYEFLSLCTGMNDPYARSERQVSAKPLVGDEDDAMTLEQANDNGLLAPDCMTT